jgi:tetratricopeptide (TPR) repeat protein
MAFLPRVLTRNQNQLTGDNYEICNTPHRRPDQHCNRNIRLRRRFRLNQTSQDHKNDRGLQKWHCLGQKTKSCLQADAHNLTDDDRYDAARELAYAGQYENAMKILEVAENQNDPRILNYKGFTNRKLGNVDLAMAFYNQAITANPDYILARSYMGQGMVSLGDNAGARNQLAEIKARGGQDTWAYASLAKALNGETSDW